MTTALWILLVIALLLTALNLLRVGVDAEYDGEGLFLRVKAGPIKITILPKQEKPENRGKEKRDREYIIDHPHPADIKRGGEKFRKEKPSLILLHQEPFDKIPPVIVSKHRSETQERTKPYPPIFQCFADAMR